MGYPQAKRSVHLAYATVNAADGTPFSSRTMNGLGLGKIRETVEARVAPDIRKRYGSGRLEPEVIELIQDFALAVIKYGFLRVDAPVSIRFDLDEWLRLDGDSALSLLHLYAKSKKILVENGNAPDPVTLSLVLQTEKELLEHLRKYPSLSLTAASRYRPSLVTQYLYELAGFYTRFLAEARNSDTQRSLTHSHLALVEATAAVLHNGLTILGIRIPRGL